MAQKRCFSARVCDSDRFMNLSKDAQLLYFHFGIRADDAGFVGNSRMIARMIEVDYSVINELEENDYILSFDTGVYVIKDWHINNTLQSDRIKDSVYKSELERLEKDENKRYRFSEKSADPTLETKCIQDGNKMEQQVKLREVKLREVKRREVKLSEVKENASEPGNDNNNKSESIFDTVNGVYDLFNKICTSYDKAEPSEKRNIAVLTVLDSHGMQFIEKAFLKAEKSDYLSGRKDQSKYRVNFDWILSHIEEIASGKYDDFKRKPDKQPAGESRDLSFLER